MSAQSNNIENVLCPVCNLSSLDNCILCDICRSWLHASCSKISKRAVLSLSQNNDAWFCHLCLINNMPFQTITNLQVHYLCFNSNDCHTANVCNVCNKHIVINNNSKNFCQLGKHNCHLKCVNLNKKKA